MPPTDKFRACLNCSSAKAKCVWPQSQSSSPEPTCQRCSKNGLSCSRLPQGLKRPRGKAVRTKMIEQKLDDIMSILSHERRSPAHSASVATTPAVAHHTFAPAPATYIDGRITIFPGYEISMGEADKLLQYYSDDLVPQFPFVPLSVHTASSMQSSNPLLLSAILRVCHPLDPDKDMEFERWFRHQIAYRTVVEKEKNTELLQALVVFLTWNIAEFYVRGYETVLLQIAIGLIGELKLTRRPNSSTTLVDDAMYIRNEPSPRDPPQTRADHRAMLGIFFLSSTLSSFFDKPSRLEYTDYLDECCDNLLDVKEFETDVLLVYMVRLRKIAVKMQDAIGSRGDYLKGMTLPGTHTMTVATVQRELDDFMSHLPVALCSSHLLVNDCNAIRIRLLEPAIYASLSERPSASAQRTRMLWDCLAAAEALFESCLAMPPEAFSAMCISTIIHMAVAMVKSLKLLSLDDRDWDRVTARQTYNLGETFQRLHDRYDAAYRCDKPRAGILKDGRPLMVRYAERMGWLRDWYAAKVAPAMATPPTTTTTALTGVLAQGTGDFDMAMMGDPSVDFWQQLSSLGNWIDGGMTDVVT